VQSCTGIEKALQNANSVVLLTLADVLDVLDVLITKLKVQLSYHVNGVLGSRLNGLKK